MRVDNDPVRMFSAPTPGCHGFRRKSCSLPGRSLAMRASASEAHARSAVGRPRSLDLAPQTGLEQDPLHAPEACN